MVYKEKNTEHGVPKEVKVVFGGLAGMLATATTHPLDLLKVRLQLCKDSTTYSMARDIIVNDGFRGLYAGLSAGLLRQATYTTTRLGVYNWLFDSYKLKHNENPSFGTKIMIGVYAGIAGAFMGTPSEVILVRMMADGPHYPCYCRRQYHGILHAIYKISKQDGITALWRGGVPTILRSILVSTAQLGTYAQSREKMLSLQYKDDLTLHVYCSLMASLATAIVSLPMDNLKTRTQFSGEKRGQFVVFKNMITDEGILSLWRGFRPYFYRLSIHTVLTFVFLEELINIYLAIRRSY